MIIDETITFLQQGADLLNRVPEKVYRNNNHPYFSSGAGRHIRHILDHYRCFLNGYGSEIDYDARERNPRSENERDFGIQQIQAVIAQLRSLPRDDGFLSQPVRIRGNEGFETAWSDSTIRREMQFLLSHTVHHYALLAMILTMQGERPPAQFGVAPSTLVYQRGN